MGLIIIVFLLVCFFASAIGAICGIGGGVIIKPVLDAFHVLDVSSISFLSGCTVLAMTTYSVIRSKASGKSKIDQRTSFPLAMGAVAGGLLGKEIFNLISQRASDTDEVGFIQSFCLLVITIGTFLYNLEKKKIHTKTIRNAAACVLIGVALGMMSSFLGIGGGPINLIVLFYFFSMTTKTAAENSLYIIFFSQIASLVTSIVSRSIPDVDLRLLILMSIGGILGGMFGRAVNKKISDEKVDKLFMLIMLVIIGINIYNMYIFSR